MCYQHATTFAERDRFVQLHQAGLTYAEIAQQCGWKSETVRKHCLAFACAGVMALQPQLSGGVPQGLLSTFDPVGGRRPAPKNKSQRRLSTQIGARCHFIARWKPQKAPSIPTKNYHTSKMKVPAILRKP